MLRILQEETPSGYILFLDGQLDTNMTEYFQSVVKPLAEQAEIDLHLNLKDLYYVDKIGLGIIINILKLRRSMGADLHVDDMSPKVRRIFERTGVVRLLS